MDSQIQKTGSDTVDRPDPSPLRGDLGPAKITIMVVAAAAPLTVMGGPALLGLGLGNGVGMPATFLVGITAATVGRVERPGATGAVTSVSAGAEAKLHAPLD